MNPLPRYLAATLVALACPSGACAAEAEAGRNPFNPEAATARATTATAVENGPGGDGAVRPNLPTLRLPPPIPTVEGRASLPPVLPPSLPPPPLPTTAGPAGGDPPASAGREAGSRRVFLSQQELQAQRSQCDITRKGSITEAVSSLGGTVTLRYFVSNGRACLSGAASDSTWANVSRADEGQASVLVEPNDGATPRETTVTVVSRNGRSASFVISQPAGNGGSIRANEPRRTASSQ